MNSQSSLLRTVKIQLNTTSLTRLIPTFLSLISINRVNRQTTNKRIKRNRTLFKHKRSINNFNRRIRTTRRSIINIQTFNNILNRLRKITRRVNILSSLIALMRITRGRRFKTGALLNINSTLLRLLIKNLTMFIQRRLLTQHINKRAIRRQNAKAMTKYNNIRIP